MKNIEHTSLLLVWRLHALDGGLLKFVSEILKLQFPFFDEVFIAFPHLV